MTPLPSDHGQTLPADAKGDAGRSFAIAALALGAGSILLVVVGLTVLPYAFAVSFLLALVAVICGSLGLHRSRHKQTRLVAIAGGALGLVPWLLFGLLALVFVFSPGD
jgi:hypothetical protein